MSEILLKDGDNMNITHSTPVIDALALLNCTDFIGKSVQDVTKLLQSNEASEIVYTPITRIPDDLLFAFSVFMQNGGWEISANKNGLSFKRDKMVAKVLGSPKIKQEHYAMNNHCIARFKIFSKLYLKHGKQFLADLRMQGSVLIHGQLQQMQKQSYLRMVA